MGKVMIMKKVMVKEKREKVIRVIRKVIRMVKEKRNPKKKVVKMKKTMVDGLMMSQMDLKMLGMQ